jgi:hypothetical protein
MATRIEINDIQAELLRRIERPGPAEPIELCRDGEVVAHLLFVGPSQQVPDGPKPAAAGERNFALPISFWEPMALVDEKDVKEGR